MDHVVVQAARDMRIDGAHGKRLLHWLGSGLALLGIGFVVFKLLAYRDQFDLSRLSGQDWFTLLLLAVLCGLSGVLLGFAWRALLQKHGVTIPMTSAVRIYGISQIAKYVPSNVVHLLGRQALCAAESLPTWPVAKSTLWELGCLPFAALMCAPLAIPLVVPALSPLVGVVGFVVTLALGIVAASRLLGASVARAVVYQTAYLFIAGLQFLVVLMILAPDAALGPWALAICGASVLAWAAGFLTPGAPAGVGVREVVLYMLLSQLVSQPELLAAVVLARMVSVCGDVLFYIGAVGAGRRLNAGALS